MKTTKNILLYLLSGFLLLCIMLTTSGCAGTSAPADNCYIQIINHKSTLEWDLYFWDADCDDVCDGATLEFVNPGPGELGGVPLTAEQAWKFWTDYLHEQKRMGA